MVARAASPPLLLTIVATIVSLLWGGVLALRHIEGHASVLDRMEAPLVDLRVQMAGPRPVPSDLLIVAIDDALVQEVGRFPLPRQMVAQLIRDLHKLGPRALAVDILFIDPGDPKVDEDLAAALRDAGAIVAAAAIFPRDGHATPPTHSSGDNLPRAERLLLPIPPVREVAGIGIVNIVTDGGGTPRHVPLAVRAGKTILPSFALRVASVATGSDPHIGADRVVLGSVETVPDLGWSLPLRFYGARGTIRTISARHVLHGQVGAGEINGRIVVVGSTAVGTGDTFSTPFDPIFPGVEILTTAIGHLTSGDGLVRSRRTRLFDGAAALCLSAATVLLIVWRSVGMGLALLCMLAAAWSAGAVIAFRHGVWLSMTVPLAAMALPALFSVAARFWLDRQVERQLLTAQTNLRRFHPPVLADHLVRESDFLDAPVEQNAAVLFVDLTGFTGLSERLGPARTRSLLKEFHTVVEDVVTAHGGVVVSFMGDGAMIVFGIPEPREDDASRALASATDLAMAAKRWIGDLPADARATDVRIGAHYGRVVVSRLGPDTHQHITATGDSVNVASRLLEVAAQHNAVVAFSTDLLGSARSPAPLGLGDEVEVRIRGRSQILRVRHWRPDT